MTGDSNSYTADDDLKGFQRTLAALSQGLGELSEREKLLASMAYGDGRIHALRQCGPNDEGWIPVEKELPDYDEYVLWHHAQGHCYVWEIDKDMDWPWIEEHWKDNMPTHWKRITPPHATSGGM